MSLCGIKFLNCEGFEIEAGVKNLTIEKTSINQAIRYSNKENDFVGVKIKGSNDKLPYRHVLET